MRRCTVVLILCAGVSAYAHADTLQYTFSQTYPNSPTHTYSFTLPSNPTPQDLIVNNSQGFFAVQNVNALVDGAPGKYLVVFTFSTGSALGGGSMVLSGNFYGGNTTLTYFNVSGKPMYSGLPTAPTLLTGNFSLQEFGPPYGGDLGTLVVTDLTTATPEPSSFALLGTGIAGLAAFARRRLAS